MNIQTVRLGETDWKVANGHIYPVEVDDIAITTLESVLAEHGFITVHLDLVYDPYEQDGYLCVHEATYKVGLSRQRGARHAIVPLRRSGIINILVNKKLVYTSHQGI